MHTSHVPKEPAGDARAPAPAADPLLVGALADALRTGGALTPPALDAASALGARLREQGRSRDAVSAAVRRALAAAPPAMTACAFEPIARALVAEALREHAARAPRPVR